jgi:hypothetical protein
MPGMSAAEALLQSIQTLPTNYQPPIDIGQAIQAACENLMPERVQVVEVILTLLGASPTAWCAPPQTPLEFPRDHAVHPGCGPEWYWLTANLAVEGSSTQSIAFVLSMERQQPISPEVQSLAGWGERETQLVFSYACAILRTGDTAQIFTRRPNILWPPLTGTGAPTTMSKPGEPFVFACGPDSLQGTVDVMPLTVTVCDEIPGGDSLLINVTCTPGMPASEAFFLQGDNGLTPPPRMGTYYSWPQLAVAGTISLGGAEYTVSGTGWLDHEMMYGDLPPLTPAKPPPNRWRAPKGIYGWSFCDFNFANGDALVLAGFQEELLLTGLPAVYGFYLTPGPGGWTKSPAIGEIAIEAMMPLTADCMMPIAWTCVFGSDAPLFTATVTTDPLWYDGSFLAANMSVQGETPVNLILSVGDEIIPGAGYCESVGYEPPARYVARALAYLASQS